MRILDRGTNAIQNVLSTVIFSIGPQMVDIVLACGYIAYKLEAWIGEGGPLQIPERLPFVLTSLH
jgi:ABC-type transport system involved in Fe-S cluster assembly fused permease/ATPase subunit